MKLTEKIYSAAFILIVAGATVFLNRPRTHKVDTNEINIKSLEFADYDLNNNDESIQLVPNSIEIGGDLEIDFVVDSNSITALWNRPKIGNNTYDVFLNDDLVKTIKSKGKELYYSVNYSNFDIGNNSISIKTSNKENQIWVEK